MSMIFATRSFHRDIVIDAAGCRVASLLILESVFPNKHTSAILRPKSLPVSHMLFSVSVRQLWRESDINMTLVVDKCLAVSKITQ